MSAADLSGRTVLVTGAASGIGAAIARVLHEWGADVVGTDLNAEGLDASLADLSRARGVVMDVADPASVDAVIGDLAVPGLDGVVHAAGVDDPVTKALVREQLASGQPLDVLTSLADTQWRRMMAVNLDGTFHVLRAALRVMRPRGAGSVVLIGSEAGAHGLAGSAHYGASKAGVHGLLRAVSQEAATYGVRVNGIAPGVIETPMSSRSAGFFGSSEEKAVAPVGRKGRPEEIANVAAFLVSDLASYVVGELVNVDGGRMAM